jgi:hypothetical protein
MSAPDDLARFVEPISRAVRDGDPQLVLDLFRATPPEARPDVLLLLLVGQARPARPVVLSAAPAVAPRPLIAPPGYEELVGERFGPAARRGAP